MIDRIKKLKIRTKLAGIIIVSGILCIILFWFLWYSRWNVWFICSKCFPQLTTDWDELEETLRTEALKYELPETEDDITRVKKLDSFFALTDDYTAVHIYGSDDGMFRASKMPEMMNSPSFRPFFDTGYTITGGDGEDMTVFSTQFQNGMGDVQLVFYHRSRISYPWFLISICMSILTFLAIILFFVNKKMRDVISLKEEILVMASGDLNHPVPSCGEDEIGILSRELDQLRLALGKNICREQESRKANQDLITALSHDLRTPLTILNGYLEVLKLNRCQDMQEEYLNRCLQKTADIKEMTDRMFEYALVSEEDETPDLVRLSTDFVRQCLLENSDFIRLTGFTVHLDFPDGSAEFLSDGTMLKRILNNLFSNILKYGNKTDPVSITGSVNEKQLKIQLKNTIKQEYTEMESNHIGLKSVEKMMALMGGQLQILEDNRNFSIQLLFPLA